MPLHRWFILALIFVSLAGCASIPPMQKATFNNSNSEKNLAYARPDLTAQLSHLQKGINEDNTLLYFQNFGGGGLALGLMGPFGVMANMKMIETNTNNDAAQLHGKPMPDPHQAFQQAAENLNVSIASQATPQDIRITPTILISKTTPSDFHISALLFIEGGVDKGKWTHRYQYQLSGPYSFEQLTNLSPAKVNVIQAQAVEGFAALLEQVKAETDASIANEKKITFESAYFSPRFTYEMLGTLAGEKDNRVWVRTMLGLTAIDPKDVKFKPQ